MPLEIPRPRALADFEGSPVRFVAAEEESGEMHIEHTRPCKRAHTPVLHTADSHWSRVRLDVGRTGRQRAVRVRLKTSPAIAFAY